MTSKRYLEVFSDLSPVDWCSFIEREGPLGLLGAPVVAKLCGRSEWPGPPSLILEWGGSSLPVGGGGYAGILGSKPKLSMLPQPRPPRRGMGSFEANPLLIRRTHPAISESPFPGCVESDVGPVGLLELEPLDAVPEPGSCSAREWRASEPPRIAVEPLAVQGTCRETLTPVGERLLLCGDSDEFLLVAGPHAVAKGSLAIQTQCYDYWIEVLHPGGPLRFYCGGELELRSMAVAVECPRARLYASSPWGIILRVRRGGVEIQGLNGFYAIGRGGIMDAARALFELAWRPDYRWPRTGIGHARCGGCVGSSLVEGDKVYLYAWTPGGKPGVLEVRLRVPSTNKARVLDATGESWVPIERGLFRVPLSEGWHVLVEISIEERVWERLRARLSGRKGSER